MQQELPMEMPHTHIRRIGYSEAMVVVYSYATIVGECHQDYDGFHFVANDKAGRLAIISVMHSGDVFQYHGPSDRLWKRWEVMKGGGYI